MYIVILKSSRINGVEEGEVHRLYDLLVDVPNVNNGVEDSCKWLAHLSGSFSVASVWKWGELTRGVKYKKSVLSIWKIVPLAVMWSIWKLRNECLFNEGQPDFEELKELVRVPVGACLGCFVSLVGPSPSSWLELADDRLENFIALRYLSSIPLQALRFFVCSVVAAPSDASYLCLFERLFASKETVQDCQLGGPLNYGTYVEMLATKLERMIFKLFFFGISTVILKRLRETLSAALIFQDLSFFDKEAVGDLTSRLGTDRQRLSHVIENDIHLILRSSLWGIGALINLLTLSWPLAFSTLVICSVLSTIFLFYGQFQKKAAKFTQEYSASANEAAQETFSLIRTVRVYGTEEEGLGRYKQWLDKLVYIGIRESVAYGSWYLSFNTLYRSTQVFAVLLGGMSILTGHVSAEQLMKYVLYCEWLIYAAWRLEDKLSSLLQAIGASEKVFQLMVPMPSDQFLSKGMKLQRLVGKIEFVNVSFYYPSRSMVPVLEHVNISVQTNELVAIAVLSGSGKSTLMNLLLRLYEPYFLEASSCFQK
ncbi:ABC transporter B family member 26, chloroplastic-like [Camellia sinensis]|uniref:ABC transporter B family member 26, chloroplastic-like n=1 Tax=Camellia sinensis TaxID=4442 RepID=UPI001035EFCB|nr:ABC transporter B family member 26, chloroplastic-like [Camellia sinensis]